MDETTARNLLDQLYAGTVGAANLYDTALADARTADTSGHTPATPGWTPTYDGWIAAANVADMLALRQAASPAATRLAEFSSEGSSFKLDTGAPTNWASLAGQLRARSPLAASCPPGVGTLEARA